MKKLLTLLGAVGLTTTAGVSVVACSKKSAPVVKFDLKNSEKKDLGKFDHLPVPESKESVKLVKIFSI